MIRRRSGRATAAVLTVVALLVSGCVDLPSSGPVVEVDVAGEQDADRPSFADARPPQPGASRLEIVYGFLEAMMAWPITTNVAKQYLSEDAAEEWSPTTTVIYTNLATPREDGSSVSLRMRDAALLDESGGWRGPLTGDRNRLSFQLTIEGGEFRIIDPVDALVVRSSWFQDRYQQASLYYFDPTWQVLVPEPVFVPVGETYASNLVAALVAGPPARLRDVLHTFVPPGLDVGLSVPVTDGVASIDLRGDAPHPSATQAELFLAQMAATLRQVPSIDAVRVTIDGEEVDPPGSSADYDVTAADEFDAAATGSTGVLYGLQRGRVVSGMIGDLRPVEGPLGRQRHEFSTVAASPIGDRIAAVTADDGRAVVAPLGAGSSAVGSTAAEGERLTQPSWDASGRLWLLDRTRSGARVLVSNNGAPAREVEVDGVTGSGARRILVSRDGTRLVALVGTARGDRLVAARVVIDSRGRVARVVESTVIRSGIARRAIDLAWTGPAEIAVLTPARPGELYEVETVAADGATVGVDTLSTMVAGRVTGLAGEAYADTPVYGVARDALVDIRAGERFVSGRGITELDYAG
jgi:hypothetical protein